MFCCAGSYIAALAGKSKSEKHLFAIRQGDYFRVFPGEKASSFLDTLALFFAPMASYAPATVPAAFRRGNVLFVPRGAALPANCVKCGVPAQRPWRKKFFWHTPGLYALFIFGLIGAIIYAIVAASIRKTMELNVPLCEEHQGARKRNLTIGWILLALSIPLGIAVGNIPSVNPGIGVLAGVVVFIVSLVFLGMAGSYMRPKIIDDFHAEFNGPGEPFLQLVPPQ